MTRLPVQFEKYETSNIKKVSELKASDGVTISFADKNEKSTDTIQDNSSIPLSLVKVKSNDFSDSSCTRQLLKWKQNPRAGLLQ